MFLFTWLKSRDYLGSKVGFTINSNDTHQTVFGGLMSTLLTVLYLYFFHELAQNLIYRTNPVGYVQIKPLPVENKKLELHNGFFLSGFQIMDWDGKPYNLEDYFFPIFEYKEFVQDEKTKLFSDTRTKLNTITCDKHKWNTKEFGEKEIKQMTGHFNLKDFYCPDLTGLGDDKKLYGNFNEDKLSYVSFRLSLCNRDKTLCKDIKKIRDFFDKNEVFISAVYTKSEYFIDDKEQPFEIKLHNHYTYLNNANFLMEEYYFQQSQLDEDMGILFDDIKPHSHIAIKQILPLNDFRGPEMLEKNLYEHQMHRYENYYMAEIFFDTHMKYHFRKYLKLPDIFAGVGGMMDFVSLIVVFFMSYYSKWRLDSYLCQRLIYIEDEQGLNFEGKYLKYSMKEIEKNKKMIKNYLNFSTNDNNEKEEEKESLLNLRNNANSNDSPQHYSRMKSNNSSCDLKKIPNYSNLNEIDNSNNLNNLNDINKFKYNSQSINNNKSGLDISKKIEMSNIEILENNEKNNNNNNENNDNLSQSQRKINQNDNNDNSKVNSNSNSKIEEKKIIKDYLETSINKFREFKNTLEFKLQNYLIYVLCPKTNKELRPNYTAINSYCDKIYEKFDIFYYMHELKKSEFIQNSLYKDKQKKLFDLMSKKSFRISFENIDNEENEEKLKDIDLEILDYVLDFKNRKNSEEHKRVINNFIN